MARQAEYTEYTEGGNINVSVFFRVIRVFRGYLIVFICVIAADHRVCEICG